MEMPKQNILTRLSWYRTRRTAWHDWLDRHFDVGYVLTLGTSLCQKCHIITKISFAAALVKHTNNPIWNSMIFFNDRCC